MNIFGYFLSLPELFLFFITIILVSLIDFITLIRARLKKYEEIPFNYPQNNDYNILIPIFGDLRYLKNVDFLAPYGDKVILCTTTKEKKEFDVAIELISQKYNFQIFRSHIPLATKKHKPNPWRLFTNTLHNKREGLNDGNEINKEIVRDEIIKDSFDVVNKKYCVFLDGDTIADKNLGQLIEYVSQKGYDLCSVRVLASKRETLIEKLQAIEYELAMDARKIYPWLTSGACMVAKTGVIKDIMQHHSLFFSVGDIEIGKLARLLKYNVGHANFKFYTDVPETFKIWFKQRMAWCGGGSDTR